MGLSWSSYVALAPFLQAFPQIKTLGIRPSLVDYDSSEIELLRQAQCILFPTPRFVRILDAVGKATFPSMASYAFRSSRILQYHLLAYHGVPTPRARWYYGSQQKRRIIADFNFPMIACGPTTVPGSKQLIATSQELGDWVERFNPVLIQEHLPLTLRLRLICLNCRCLGAQQSQREGNGYQRFLPVDGRNPIVDQVIEFTLRLLRMHGLDDVALEWGYGRDQWWALGVSRPPVVFGTSDGMVNRHEVVGRMVTEAIPH